MLNNAKISLLNLKFPLIKRKERKKQLRDNTSGNGWGQPNNSWG